MIQTVILARSAPKRVCGRAGTKGVDPMTPRKCRAAHVLWWRLCLSAVVLVAAATGVSEARAAVLVVDKDKAQCPRARYTSIQRAVDAARRGDKVKVCADHYAEQVTIDKPLTLHGDPDAVAAIDCFAAAPSEAGELDPTRYPVVDPAGDGFSVAFRLAANNIGLKGLVVEGASVGIDASDSFSGYRVDHNLIQHHTGFAIDFGSAGDRRSRVDHNCIRNNSLGLASELDDDSNWPLPPVGTNREPYARDTFSARIDHNDMTANTQAIYLAGPGQRKDVRIDHNHSQHDRNVGIVLQNSTDSAIVDNDIIEPGPTAWGIGIGGGNTALLIADNRLVGGLVGINFGRDEEFFDQFPLPNTNVVVSGNDIRSTRFSGIQALTDALAASIITGNTSRENARAGIVISGGRDNEITANTTSENQGTGISLTDANTDSDVSSNISTRNGASGLFLGVGSTRNNFTNNTANDNGRHGIGLAANATGNTFTGNAMHGNGRLDPAGRDAFDPNFPLNTWIGNDCTTDNQAGAICSTG